MKAPRLALMLTLMAATAVLALHHVAAVRTPDRIEIVSPRKGEVVRTDALTVTFRTGRASAATNSAFAYELQLDGKQPVRTTDATYRLSGLSPGQHHIRVQLVSTDGTAALHATGAVDFAASGDKAHELPETGSVLPLLSVIGFGVLLGGLASVLKTR